MPKSTRRTIVAIGLLCAILASSLLLCNRPPVPQPTPTRTTTQHESSDSELFPLIRVLVTAEDSEWRSDGPFEAYALVATDPGLRGPVAVSAVGASDTCVLRLPRHGRYDIGVTSTSGTVARWGISCDVDTRSTPRVTVTLPRLVAVRLTAGPGVSQAEVELDVDESLTIAERPGRSATKPLGRLISSDFPITYRIMSGVRLRARPLTPGVRCEPGDFTAPAVVTIRKSTPDDPALYAVDVDTGQAMLEDSVTVTWVASGDVTQEQWQSAIGPSSLDAIVGSCRAYRVAPSPHFELGWRGPGLRSGSINVSAPSGTEVVVPISILPMRAVTEKKEAVFTIASPMPMGGVHYWVVQANGNGWANRHEAAEVNAITVDDHQATVIAVGISVSTSDILLSSGERKAATFHSAGRIRLHRDVQPPSDVILKLRRRDGGLLPFSYDDGVSPDAARREVSLYEPVVLLGPMPEGAVDLIVSCGGVDLTEVLATVDSGTTRDVVFSLKSDDSRK